MTYGGRAVSQHIIIRGTSWTYLISPSFACFVSLIRVEIKDKSAYTVHKSDN